MSKRTHSGGGGGGVNLSYIITPFLDMSFQLLAFFIMTYHPSALEAHVAGKLVPPADTGGPPALTSDELPGEEIDAEVRETVLIRVKAVAKEQQDENRPEGEPSEILLKLPHEAAPIVVFDRSDSQLEAGLKKLDEALRRIVKNADGAKINVKIEGDGNLRHAHVIRVYDVCRRAGCQNVSFVAPKRKK